MKLAFLAKPDHMVNRPGGRSVGAPPRYVGRRHVAVDDKAGGVAGSYPAMAQPEVFDVSPADPVFADLIRACAKGGIWPADAETAAACGVPFVALEQEKSSGEWVLKAASAPSKSASKSDSKE
jgi:hypothetical protein